MWPSFPLTENWCRTLGGSRTIWASFTLTSQPVSFTALLIPFPDHVCGGPVTLCWCTLTSQISPTCLTGTQSSCLCYLRPTTRPRRMWVLLTWFYTIPRAHTGGEPVSWDKNMYITLHGNWETYSSIAYTHTQVVNQVVLWDKIIRRGDSPLVELHTAKSKYGFFDDGRGLL